MKKVDVKSFITIALVAAMILITIALIISVIVGKIPTDNPLVNAIVLLFSNSTTMVMTYFFTKSSKEQKTDAEKAE